MEQTPAQLYAEIQRQMKSLMALVANLHAMADPTSEPQKEAVNDIDKKLKKLLHSDKWPVAVEPRRLADPNSDDDKIIRATAILDQVVDVSIAGVNFLDYGCGEGHVAYVASKDASLSVGYDIRNMGWGQFPVRHNLVLTEDPSDYHPFDVILLHDVLDHIEDDPIPILEHARDMLSPKGRICVYCHPFSSRTGGHNHNTINRAYAQLFFPDDTCGQKVLRPLDDYKAWFSAAGLIVKHERPIYNDIPKLFYLLHLADHIKSIYEEEDLPEEHLRVEGVIYSLSKEL